MFEATVFIVDDDAAMRDSLALLLGLNDLRVQVFASAEDFLATCRKEWHGCLLLDLRMGGMDGLALQRALQDRGIQLPVVIVTAHGTLAAARIAFKAGAVDFLEKPVTEDVLLAAVREALAQGINQREKALVHEEARTLLALLTPREKEVMERLAQGLSSRDIGERLGISHRTVEVYKARMMEKLGARRLPDLIRLWLANTNFPD